MTLKTDTTPTKYFFHTVEVKSIPIPPNVRIVVGTGFAIDEIHFLTAGHVCDSMFSSIMTENSSGIEFAGLDRKGMEIKGILTIDKIDIKNDICMLESDGPHGVIPLTISDGRPFP